MATSSHPGDSVLSHSGLERGPECSRLLAASYLALYPLPRQAQRPSESRMAPLVGTGWARVQVAVSLWPCLGKVPNDESERIQLCTVTVVVLLFPSVEYHHPKVGFQHQYSHPPDLT
jgi:hypothetical protein